MTTSQANQINTISVNELLPPTLKVLHFGRLSKQSIQTQKSLSSQPNISSRPQFQPRWSVLTYGIFTYFTTCDKAKKFLQSLPCSKSNSDTHQLSKMSHRVKITLHSIQIQTQKKQKRKKIKNK